MSLLAMVLVSLLLSACASSKYQNIQRGSDYMFREGFPEVRMSAIGFFNEEGEPGIQVTADIVYASLVYKQVDSRQTANITIDVRIVQTGEDQTGSSVAESFDITVSERDNSITSSQESFVFDRRFPVPPGNYTVYLTVIDRGSGKQTTRQMNTRIPSQEISQPLLTDIQLLGKNNQDKDPSFLPVTTYDVQGKVDSLKFIFQVTNGNEEVPVTIESELIRFSSDTSYARSMAAPSPSPSSIAYKGIDYDKREIIQSSRRVLRQTGSILVEFIFPMQQRGNYRFTARTEGENGDSQYKARDFSIKSTNYPAVKTPMELARPLAYLMEKKEYEQLIKHRSSDELKRAIDTFWLKNIGNKSQARQVIELYYQRVEEANKQFSNFQEGWKTDPGMLYILFGPPMDHRERLDEMVWYYSYNRQDPRKTFYFLQPKLKNPAYPFVHYLLRRTFGYNNVEYQQVQLWLSGLILSRRL